ncbi:hypothetical protein [Azospirillum doebereinerae]|uniref:MerR family transcriptional regulator n=1 Tax=Azospirillum doebereinerae TaxID=92933 RepID=A0A3S0V899_9PROT|nr:hypothetical protein [Azospirillum doebereinerae]RUQ75066.1 hypothetical protein EJ913_04195 [Azospirillum doebereinerae]
MHSNIAVPRFTTAQVAAAAELPLATLQNWLARKMLVINDDDDSPGTGRMRLFSMRRAIHISLVAELVRHGVAVSRASFIAIGFTDVGNAIAYYGNSPTTEDLKNFRAPGQNFSNGTTLLIVRPPKDGEVEADNVSVVCAESYQVPMWDLFGSNQQEGSSAIVVNMTKLCDRVAGALQA